MYYYLPSFIVPRCVVLLNHLFFVFQPACNSEVEVDYYYRDKLIISLTTSRVGMKTERESNIVIYVYLVIWFE